MNAATSLEATVIVPTYDDWAGLSNCLDCLAAQDIDQQRFEIVIGNNNPEQLAPDDLRLPTNAQLVWEPKPGSYAARNAAVAASTGSALFFTDADCRPTRDWLRCGLALLADQPRADRFGGLIRLTPAGKNWKIAEHYDRLFNLRQARYVKRGYAATANLLMRRSLFEQVGPFDDSLYSSGDKQWNRRASALGSVIRYAPDLIVEHGARASFEEHAKKRARVAKGRYLMKNEGRRDSRWSALRYRLPSLSAARVILAADDLTLNERLALWRFDQQLRGVEYETFRALAAGTAAEHR